MSDSYKTILFEVDERGVATITINRPKKLNALNAQVLDELERVVQQVHSDDSIKAVLITGAGDRAFVAGADIGELRELDEKSGLEASRRGQQIFQLIEDTRKPVIAVVNGYALGGGFELAMACHLRIASPKAVFGLPEVSLGLIPGYGGTQRLAQLVGRSRALELILTARKIDAEEALKWGVVNKVSATSLETASDLLIQMLENAPISLQQAISVVYQSDGQQGYEKEAEAFASLCATEDAREGLAAFLEKREAHFGGK